MGGVFIILHLPGFLKSGQLVTGSTSLLYKGFDGTGRSLNPDNYQPKGNYASANHNHTGVYQPVGSYATTTELNEVKTSVSNGKSAVASAITDKGVSTSATASFDTMASNIRQIVGVSDSLVNLPGGWLYSKTTFVHGIVLGWFYDAHGNTTLTYPLLSNNVKVVSGIDTTTYTNLINWRSGYGSSTRLDRFYDAGENGDGNYFFGINLQGYTKITANAYNYSGGALSTGDVNICLAQINSDGVLKLYRYTIRNTTVSLGFTGNSRPYMIIAGLANQNGYHTIQFS